MGIGVNPPTYKLDVLNASGTGIRSSSSASFSLVNIDAHSGDAALRFAANGVNQLNLRDQPTTNNLELFD